VQELEKDSSGTTAAGAGANFVTDLDFSHWQRSLTYFVLVGDWVVRRGGRGCTAELKGVGRY
jgi:hypothetical protein